MSATTEQKLEELRRAYKELRQEHDAVLAELKVRPAAQPNERNHEFDSQTGTAANNSLKTENEELRAAQAAGLEVLQAMVASPGETQPVLDLIAQQAAKLCNVPIAVVTRFDGAMIHLVAQIGMEFAEAEVLARQFPRPPSQDFALGRAILSRRIEQIVDITADPHRAFTPPPNQGSVLAVPLLRNEAPLGAIAIGRRSRGPFPKNQITLLQIFAEQAVIAITSAETYRALQERTVALSQRNTEYGERIEQQAATIDVLKVMSASPADALPVFRLVVERARAFFEADGASLALVHDDFLHLQAYDGVFRRDYEAGFPRRLNHTTMFGRAILARDVVEMPDVSLDPDYYARGTPEQVQHAIIAVPLLRAGMSLGAVAIGRRRAGKFSAAEVELLKTFAEQAVIAIGSAETYRALQARTADLQESLEYQTATSDILSAISRSTFDLQPVLSRLAETAARLCIADQAAIFLVQDNTARLATNFGFPPEYEAALEEWGTFPIIPDSPSVGYRAISERRVVHIHDVAAVPGYSEISVKLGRQRTSLGVPLLRKGEAIGLIMLARQRVEPFTERQIELVNTFAAQAVIAIENTRLLTEQREALEQQTATAEVLQVINSSPGDLKPVFDAILEKAHSLCGAERGAFVILDGDQSNVATTRGLSERYVQILREQHQNPAPSPAGPREQLLKGAAFVQRSGPIILTGPIGQAGAELENVHAVLFVPLRQDGRLLGYITAYREHQSLFSDKQIAVLRNFAAQAVIAMQNARLLTEQREALEQQIATTEVLRVINESPGTLAPVFDKLLDKARAVCGVDHAALELYDGERFYAAAVHGASDEFAELLRQGYRADASPAAQALLDGQAYLEIADATQVDLATFQAAAAIDGVRTVLFVPLRREKTLLGMIASARREVRKFTEKEISLLQNFAAQAVVAMENARLLAEQREALEQQTATAEVLQVINSSPGNLAPVFDTMLEKAMRLCEAEFGAMYTYDGKQVKTVAMRGIPASFADLRAKHPPQVRSGSPLARMLATKRSLHIPDVLVDEGYQDLDASGRSVSELLGLRTLLLVPMHRRQDVVGVIGIYWKEVHPYSDKQVALLENFASQAVIAMENARLLTEQHEALERQTATAEVLQVINGSPGNLTPVFDALLERAHRLCESSFGILCTFDGELYHTVATRGVAPGYVDLVRAPVRPVPGMCAYDLVLGKDVIHLADVTTDASYHLASPFRRALADHSRARTAIWVALRHDNALHGMINIFRNEVRPYSDQQIALLQNFAAQAVIAIDNARLINETREALEQQRASAEILRVVNSSPGNLTPVFETILDKAHTLCGAAIGSLMIYEDGYAYAAATHGFPEKHVELVRQPFRPSDQVAELIGGARFFHRLDCRSDRPDPDEITRSALESVDIRTGLWVPLRKDGACLGWISSFRLEVRPFSEKEIALLESFAAHAVIAIENARLLSEIRQRQEELRITFENMGDGVAMFDETQHLVAWNGKFQQIFDLPPDLLKQRRTYEEHLRFLAAKGYFGTNVDTAEQIHALVATTGQSYGYERTLPDGRVIEIRRNPVPDGGFVLIFSDITERKRSEEEIRAARDAAEAAYRDLKTAQASLIQAEKMASLGQLTAGIAHEIKNPLNFVNNFASLSVDLLDELKQTAAPGLAMLNDTRRAEVDELASTLASNLGKINEHGRRADGIVRSMLEHSRGSSGERRSVDLNALVDEALNLAYHGARAQDQGFNITLQREFDDGIAPITLAPQDMTRVLLNLFSNGFYAARERQRTTSGLEPSLKVSTRQLDDAVAITVRDNGIGIPSEIKDRLFQPFFTTKPPGEGTGLGLSMSYDIITQQHGGSISVDSKVGEYTEFSIWLPRTT